MMVGGVRVCSWVGPFLEATEFVQMCRFLCGSVVQVRAWRSSNRSCLSYLAWPKNNTSFVCFVIPLSSARPSYF